MFYPFSYEPELFPGLIYRMVRPRIVLLIFVSGKVVLTGIIKLLLLLLLLLKAKMSTQKTKHSVAM